jgi:hypothetical protein
MPLMNISWGPLFPYILKGIRNLPVSRTPLRQGTDFFIVCIPGGSDKKKSNWLPLLDDLRNWLYSKEAEKLYQKLAIVATI